MSMVSYRIIARVGEDVSFSGSVMLIKGRREGGKKESRKEGRREGREKERRKERKEAFNPRDIRYMYDPLEVGEDFLVGKLTS